jgi:DNA-binding transcriptional ArsR family regulator
VSATAQKHDVFQAIADPTRREVLKLLADKELPISEITSHFSISRTAIAKHLHILSEAELVRGRKQGREKIYQLRLEPLQELKQFYEQFWDNRLSVLKHLMENPENSSLKVIESKKNQE